MLEFCNQRGYRTFTLREFIEAHREEFAVFAPANTHPDAKVRQQLQFLRKDGLVTFEDNRGTYTLRGVELLNGEVDQPQLIETAPAGNERDYLAEIHARDRGWVRMARHTYGDLCLVPRCGNSFVKEDGQRYVEVHHITPLYQGGEDQIWNLSVVCAHHHRMAHFALASERQRLHATLLAQTQAILTRH